MSINIVATLSDINLETNLHTLDEFVGQDMGSISFIDNKNEESLLDIYFTSLEDVGKFKDCLDIIEKHLLEQRGD